MVSYKIPEGQLPTELQLYAKGTADLPKGDYTPLQVKSAIKYRQTFFRRLQAYKPGLQYQWPDYQKLMWPEILLYAKRVLRPKVVQRWDELTGHNSKLGLLYRTEVRRQLADKPEDIRWVQRERLLRAARETAFFQGVRDPRTLGLIEETVRGRCFYGIPSEPNYIEWPR